MRLLDSPEGKFLHIGAMSLSNHHAYASRHGYSFGATHLAGSFIHFVTPSSWAKIILFLETFSSHNPPEYIIWLDADALVRSSSFI